MAFSQRMDMRQGQSLVMTPQLQQAIKLLQLSNMDLAAYIEQELEKNPLLTRDEGSGDDAPDPSEAKDSKARDELTLDDSSGYSEARDSMDTPQSDAFDGDTASDNAATAHGSAPASGASYTEARKSGFGDEDGFESTIECRKTLREHLADQLAVCDLEPVKRLIASRLIDETDEAGFLRIDDAMLADELGVTTECLESVIATCHTFEPTGIMARSLKECLELQLRERNRFDPAMAALIAHLELVAKHDLPGLVEVCGVDRTDVLDMIAEVKSLDPRPGSGFSGEASVTVVPDVFVRELPNGAFAVELNSDTLPRVLMDRTYYGEVASLAKRASEKEFVEECAANANWLVKSLDQRARTILKVSREIIRQQDAFFVHGVAHLRPLNLKQVADAVGMHESTVSRVTSNKFMASPRGLFELKYFFSAAIPSTGTGDAHSAEAVRYRIKALVGAETDDDVLSDDQLVDKLRGFGIDVARRTVAKYRESLRIPSSVQRRRLLRQSA